MTINEILEKLKNLKRLDVFIRQEEDYDSFLDYEEAKNGDFVRSEDIDRLIKEIEKSKEYAAGDS